MASEPPRGAEVGPRRTQQQYKANAARVALMSMALGVAARAASRRPMPRRRSKPLHAVITAEGLDRLERHEYHPGGLTPLDKKLTPFWQGLTDCLPAWLPPNIVTMAGFAPLAVAYAFAWHQSPGFAAPASRGLIFFTVFALWVYQTTDAMDGKHARQLGAATPIGQLFDHGFDCLATVSLHSMACLVLLPAASRWGVAGQAALMTSFFMAQWSERHIGVLPTSYGAIGVTETQLALMLSLILGALTGADSVLSFASAMVASPFSGGALVPRGVMVCQGWSLFCASIGSICFFKTLGHVIRDTAKGAGRLKRALLDLLPPVALSALSLAWHPAVFASTPRLISLATAIPMFYFTAQMILFTMAGMAFPARQGTLLPYAALVGASWLVPGQTELMRTGVLAFTSCISIKVLTWLAQAMTEMKERLGIYIFSLKKPEHVAVRMR